MPLRVLPQWEGDIGTGAALAAAIAAASSRA